MTINIGLVGLGHIARTAHLPALAANPDFALGAVASRNSNADGIANFDRIETLLDGAPDLDAVSLCGPPQVRYRQALAALDAGKHVILEKPPGATLAEVADLDAMAADRGLTLFASWHSRAAAGVAGARNWLADKHIQNVEITWHEDVRVFHPGQQWIWQPGGLGVFDPGINALSIATRILPIPFFVTESTLRTPANRAAPIAARLAFADRNAACITAELDWGRTDAPLWRIDIETDAGNLRLDEGGDALFIDGESVSVDTETGEYDRVYERFARLIAEARRDVDISPLRHVADAFLHAEHQSVDAFHD